MSTDFEGMLDEVVEELNDRFHRGERPELEPYLEQYPQLADPLRQAYEVLAAFHLPNRSEPQIVQPSDAALGQLGDFRLLSQIARGGMGIVYEAEQISLGRRVALKTLPMAALLDPRQLQRFQNEARAAAMLDHPHIVGVFSVGCERGVYYYAMQYIDGRTLAQVIAELRQQQEIDASLPGRPTLDRIAATRRESNQSPWSASPGSTCLLDADALPEVADSAVDTRSNDAQASALNATQPSSSLQTPTISEGLTSRRHFQLVVRLGIQAAQALEHAHQMGIVHRDIKPSNLMINAAGHLWVTDFGLAQIESAAELTMTGDLLGTLRYMSPEQAQGDRRVMGHRSDIYSLGATLYELLTLRPVVQERQRAQILRAILESEPKPLRYWNRAIPRDLETIVLKSLSRQPADRYATARELADDLQRFLDDQPIRARRPTVLDRLGKWSRRHAAGLAATTVFVILLAASLTVVSMLWAQREHASRLAAEQAREAAESARETAETERNRAESNLQMALQVMDSIYLRIAATQLDGSTPDESADHSNQRDATEKPDQSARPSGVLLHSLMDFYELLAQANQDSPSSFDLVDSTYRRVVGMREELAASAPEAMGYYRALGIAYANWASFLQGAQRHEQAERLYRDALAMQQALSELFPAVPEYRWELAETHRRLAGLLTTTARRTEAQDHLAVAALFSKRHASTDDTPAAQPMRFSHFAEPEGLQLVGDASVFEDRLRLTQAAPGMQGAAWLTAQQQVAMGFDTTFHFQMSDGIADGFAFVIQNHRPTALGPGGGGLGYGGIGHLIGIPNSIAVEFDTFPDQLGELGPHISVQTNGTEPNHALSTFSLGWVMAQQMSDGGKHFARIRYVPGTLAVYLDDHESPVLTTSVDLASLLDLDDGCAWVGFTAATGFEYQNHDILSWDYQPLADPAGQTSQERQRLAKALPQHVTRVTGQSPRRSAPPSPEDGELLKEVLAFYQEFAQPGRATPKTRLHLAQACWSLGAVHQQFGQGDDAAKALGTAAQIWHGLVQEFPDQPEYQDRLRFAELEINWFRLGAFGETSRQDEKIVTLEQKLADVKATFGENRPHVLTLQSDLATAYLDAGRYDDAIVLFRRTIAALAALLGDEAPQTLSSQHGLALAYYRSGRYDDAIALHQQTLASRKAVLGEDDPHILRSQTNLALAYAKVGRHEEAIALQTQTLASQKAQFGDKHSDYASSLYVMATLHASMLQYAKAEPLFREASEIRRARFGEQHPVYAGALDRLGDLYRRMGQYDRAEPLLEQALAIRRAALGERNPSYATSLQSLAELRQAQGDIPAAKNFYRQAIDIRRETAPQHPDLAANLHTLAVLLADHGNHDEAQSLLLEALHIRQAAFGTQHPDHAETLRVLQAVTKPPL